MKVKFGENPQELEILSVSRSLNEIKNYAEDGKIYSETISISVDDAVADFESCKALCEAADYSNIYIYGEDDELLTTFHATSLQGINQNIFGEGQQQILISISCDTPAQTE